ncbi:MarR family winged helix-turn-helix transcriptional regulator [Pseudarthrobacter sp. N5]|uniref:MarR family winged helix-turn-helix transcriptional regulator n=1 Tax=Pseudarthrobacter sp. N5 TaxID=3418416 RepID=UPI003CF97DAD
MTLPESPRDDFITRLRSSWKRALPEVDTSPVELLGRITRISALSIQQLDRVLVSSGISRSEFDVLCALARSDRPLRASEVTAETMLSGAATTKLTSRLEAIGLILRQRLERDGRVVLLQLTDAGRNLVETEFPRCVAHDRELLAGLDDSEQRVLASLLQRISANAESSR